METNAPDDCPVNEIPPPLFVKTPDKIEVSVVVSEKTIVGSLRFEISRRSIDLDSTEL